MRNPPLDMSVWQGREDSAEGTAGNRWHQVIQPWPRKLAFQAPEAGGKAVTIAGFQCDAGVIRNQGRPGAALGPRSIRAALANLPARRGLILADAGDVVCADEATAAAQDPSASHPSASPSSAAHKPGPRSPDHRLEQAQAAFAGQLAAILRHGDFPLALGGGHEIAYASFCGLVQHIQSSGIAPPRLGIINFDAHFDLRQDQRPSSGTPFRQIAEDCARLGWPFHYACLGVSEFANTAALFQRARELNVVWQLDEAMVWPHLAELENTLDSFIAGVDWLYLTVCLDVLPAATAPGVSAPAARGVELGIVEHLVDHICASGKLQLADVAEMNPQYDIDQRTARVAARLAARIANAVASPATELVAVE